MISRTQISTPALRTAFLVLRTVKPSTFSTSAAISATRDAYTRGGPAPPVDAVRSQVESAVKTGKELEPNATRDEKNPEKWKAPADDVFERNAAMKSRSRDHPSSTETKDKSSEDSTDPWDKQHRYQQPSHSDAASVRQPQSENRQTAADVRKHVDARDQANSQSHARSEHGAAKARLENSRNELDRVNAMNSKMRFFGIGAATLGVFAFFSGR